MYNSHVTPEFTNSGILVGDKLRRANTELSVDFRQANTESSVEFRKTNTEPSVHHLCTANTETY